MFTPDREKKAAAASTIQQNWRRKQAVAKQQRYQRDSDDTIVGIQSVLKAHLARKRVLSLHRPAGGADGGGRGWEDVDGESSESSEAIEVIQSAMRGYLTRQMLLQDLPQNR